MEKYIVKTVVGKTRLQDKVRVYRQCNRQSDYQQGRRTFLNFRKPLISNSTSTLNAIK